MIAHPLRARCLAALADRTASPAELAAEFGRPLSDVSYHVASLLKAGAIELVSERPVRGSIQHFYRAVLRPQLDPGAELELPPEERIESARLSIQMTLAEATAALEAETFGRPGTEARRVPLTLDEAGWTELAELCAELAARMLAIGAASERRRADEDGERGMPVTAFVTFFARPPL